MLRVKNESNLLSLLINVKVQNWFLRARDCRSTQQTNKQKEKKITTWYLRSFCNIYKSKSFKEIGKNKKDEEMFWGTKKNWWEMLFDEEAQLENSSKEGKSKSKRRNNNEKNKTERISQAKNFSVQEKLTRTETKSFSLKTFQFFLWF